jgi:hypothetical protein
MSPASGTVLGAAAIVASPALWSSLVDGSMPLDVGLTRYLVAVGVCWVLLSVLGELVFAQPARAHGDDGTADADEPAGSGTAQADTSR